MNAFVLVLFAVVLDLALAVVGGVPNIDDTGLGAVVDAFVAVVAAQVMLLVATVAVVVIGNVGNAVLHHLAPAAVCE